MNCPGCGASMRIEEGRENLICDYCGRRHFPEPDADGVIPLGEPAGILCPVCGAGLEEAVVGGMRVRHCPQCRGLLVPMGEFVALVESLRAQRNPAAAPEPPHSIGPAELERRIRCPQCGTAMNTHPYGGPGNIVIDNCEPCALNWLDHAELWRIVGSVDASPQEPAWMEP